MYVAELDNTGVSFCYLARDAQRRAVGFCSFWRVLDELHINNLAVLPELRRHGVGTLLLEFVLEKGAELGARRATLEVRRSNEPARALYERFGFSVAGVRPRVLHPNRSRMRWCCGARISRITSADILQSTARPCGTFGPNDQGGGL